MLVELSLLARYLRLADFTQLYLMNDTLFGLIRDTFKKLVCS